METQEKISIRNNRVWLHLPEATYKPYRQLGYIKDRIFYTFRKTDNHTFRKNNSIGMNYKLLSQGGEFFDLIHIDYGLTKCLETSREFFLHNGKFLHFKNLDRQIFLSLDLFGMDKVEAWNRNTKTAKEPDKKLQNNLFQDL